MNSYEKGRMKRGRKDLGLFVGMKEVKESHELMEEYQHEYEYECGHYNRISKEEEEETKIYS